MRLFGLIGYPLSHSFSKNYFTAKFEREGPPDCRYEIFPIKNIEGIGDILRLNPDLEGLNVTIPYKEQVLPYLDTMSDVVKEIKACNCIKIAQGKLHGFNTDTTGFERSLLKDLQPHHKKALILGTGGAAKAVEYVLNKLRIQYTHVSRNALGSNLSYDQVTPQIISECTLIINTTPVGMFPNISKAPLLPYGYLTDAHFLFDLTYNPPKTLFLQKGEAKGATIQNGMDMLVVQAEESWRLWEG